MSDETCEARFGRLSAVADAKGTSWDAEAAKEISTLTQGINWRNALRESIRAKAPEAMSTLRAALAGDLHNFAHEKP